MTGRLPPPAGWGVYATTAAGLSTVRWRRALPAALVAPDLLSLPFAVVHVVATALDVVQPGLTVTVASIGKATPAALGLVYRLLAAGWSPAALRALAQPERRALLAAVADPAP